MLYTYDFVLQENNAPTVKTDKKSNTAVDSVEPPFYSVVLEKLATRSFKEYLPTLMERLVYVNFVLNIIIKLLHWVSSQHAHLGWFI